MDRLAVRATPRVEDDNTRRGLPVHGALQRTRDANDHHNRTHHKHHQRHIKYISIWAVALLLPSQALAQVNATASPSSVSNGSVTNQAVQMLNGPFPAYHLGPNQISCQGPTLSLSPFLTTSHSYTLPRRQYQRTPFYNPVDANEDGAPDYPGEILFWSKAPTGQKDSHSVNAGIALTASFPLDGGLHERCKALGAAQLKLMEQKLAHARLDYEIGRLKHCGKLAQDGITFKPGSQAAIICADVVLIPKPGQVLPHKHSITAPKPDAKPSQPGSALFAPGVVRQGSTGEAYALASP